MGALAGAEIEMQIVFATLIVIVIGAPFALLAAGCWGAWNLMKNLAGLDQEDD